MKEGILVEWTVEEGDVVEAEDTIAIVETDKVTADVEAREAGVVQQLLAEAEDVLDPGEPIGILTGADEDIQPYRDEVADSAETGAGSTGDEQAASGSTPVSDSPTQTASSESIPGTDGATVDSGTDSDADIKATPGARKLAEERDIDLSLVDGTGPAGTIVEEDIEQPLATASGPTQDSEPASDADIKATPGARKLAEESGTDLSMVDGTGPAGTIIERDIERALETADGAEPHTEGPEDTETRTTVTERNPLTGIQKRVGERLQASFQEVPHVTLHRTYSTDELHETLALAERLGVDISINDVLLKVSAQALSKHPAVNAHFEDGEHAIIEEQNLAFAVDTDDGLVTPVVSSVGERSIQSVNATRRELTERALAGNLTVDDLQGGTFTVTNLGMYGVDQFTPIINPPQIAILGVGRERDDGTMTLSLSFDHRVINGADAAKFLSTITDILTSSENLDGYLTDLV